MTPAQISEAAGLLAAAYRDGRMLDGLPDSCRPQTEDDANLIQDAVVDQLGVKVAGWKVGATTKEAQANMGFSAPFTGRLLAPIMCTSPVRLLHRELLFPRVECEFALRVGIDLVDRGQPYRRDEVAEVVTALYPGIEIPESRFADGHGLGALALIADQGATGRYVLGAECTDWRHLNLPSCRVVLRINGEVVAAGSGADAMGDPLDSLTWVANHCAAKGDSLRADQVVSTGSCTGIIPVEPGDEVVADFGDLGTVEVSFPA
jgi:2-keto-4-pentenoate hydratase